MCDSGCPYEITDGENAGVCNRGKRLIKPFCHCYDQDEDPNFDHDQGAEDTTCRQIEAIKDAKIQALQEKE